MEKDRLLSQRAQRRIAEQRRTRLAAPFFIALYLLFLLGLCIPLRPAESLHEKRRLTAFPSFSLSALVSGDYFDGVTLWFSDTFPGREAWLALASEVNDLHGVYTNAVSYTAVTADEIPSAPAVLPSSAPVAVELPFAGEEAAATDDEIWKGLDITGEEQTLFGNCVQISGSAFELYGFNQALADYRIVVFNRGAEALAGLNVRLFDMPAPSGMNVMLSPDFVEKLGCSQQADALAYLFAGESKDIIKVDLLEALTKHNDEYIYFNTDHHWTALGAYYAYERYCQAAGLTPAKLDSFREINMGEFLGSFYYSSTKPGTLKPDELIAYVPPGDLHMEITDTDGGHHEAEVVTDVSEYDASAKYSAFIGGDNHLTVMTNDALPDAPNCVLVKDSYGNPLSVFLTQNYHKVYVIDYRMYGSAMSDFIREYDIDDVIISESMGLTQGESANSLLSYILR